MSRKTTIGIDISARSFDAALWQASPQDLGHYPQTEAGYEEFLKKLSEQGCTPTTTQVVMEATGTYWMKLARHLHEAGYALSILNPQHSHAFAQAIGQRAKTDRLDARLLAEMGHRLDMLTWTPPTDLWEEVYQRLIERDGLVEMRQQIRNKRHARQQRGYAISLIDQRELFLLEQLDEQIKQIDRELQGLLRLDPYWQDLAERLRSIPGFGLLSTCWMLVVTRGFTTGHSAEQLTSYLGLVPHPRQSGTTRKGYQATGGGHSRARRVLYQAGVSAARFNPVLKDFYNRLIAAGKPVRVARIAVVRKLVVMADAIVRHQSYFDPAFSAVSP